MSTSFYTITNAPNILLNIVWYKLAKKICQRYNDQNYFINCNTCTHHYKNALNDVDFVNSINNLITHQNTCNHYPDYFVNKHFNKLFLNVANMHYKKYVYFNGDHKFTELLKYGPDDNIIMSINAKRRKDNRDLYANNLYFSFKFIDSLFTHEYYSDIVLSLHGGNSITYNEFSDLGIIPKGGELAYSDDKLHLHLGNLYNFGVDRLSKKNKIGATENFMSTYEKFAKDQRWVIQINNKEIFANNIAYNYQYLKYPLGKDVAGKEIYLSGKKNFINDNKVGLSKINKTMTEIANWFHTFIFELSYFDFDELKFDENIIPFTNNQTINYQIYENINFPREINNLYNNNRTIINNMKQIFNEKMGFFINELNNLKLFFDGEFFLNKLENEYTSETTNTDPNFIDQLNMFLSKIYLLFYLLSNGNDTIIEKKLKYTFVQILKNNSELSENKTKSDLEKLCKELFNKIGKIRIVKLLIQPDETNPIENKNKNKVNCDALTLCKESLFQKLADFNSMSKDFFDAYIVFTEFDELNEKFKTNKLHSRVLRDYSRFNIIFLKLTIKAPSCEEKNKDKYKYLKYKEKYLLLKKKISMIK